MSSEIFWCAVFLLLLVGCAIILWFFLDHVKKRRRPRKKIWICSDLWMDILPSFNHAQLGLKMALLSDRFDVLVDAHFDGKTTELTICKWIKIRKDEGPKPTLSVLIDDDDNFVDFPLPDRPLPDKICFRDLQINYIDHSVITFLHANKQIWDRMGTNLELYIENVQPIWDVFVPEIWPIFATNIRQLGFNDATEDLDNFRRRTSPTILTDLDQLNSIDAGCLLPDGIADDGPNATAAQALFRWLHTPSKNGQPKELYRNNYFGQPDFEWVNNFKETFLRATTSVSYTIQLYFCVDTMPIEPFELVNEMTKEKLTLKVSEEYNGSVYNNWLMQRCPIWETATAPIKFELRYDNNSGAKLNRILFDLCDENHCIGPLSPPAEEEKEEDEADQSNKKLV